MARSPDAKALKAYGFGGEEEAAQSIQEVLHSTDASLWLPVLPQLRFYHGTSWEAATKIAREGFKPSIDGCLGPGVYVGRRDKALRFAQDHARHGSSAGGLITTVVSFSRPKFVAGDDCGWQAEGYDACRTDGTSLSSTMEWAIANPRQVEVVEVEHVPLDRPALAAEIAGVELFSTIDVNTAGAPGVGELELAAAGASIEDVVSEMVAEVEVVEAVKTHGQPTHLPSESLQLASQNSTFTAGLRWVCGCGGGAAAWRPCELCGSPQPVTAMKAAVAAAEEVLNETHDVASVAEASPHHTAFKLGVMDGFCLGRMEKLEALPAALQHTEYAALAAPPPTGEKLRWVDQVSSPTSYPSSQACLCPHSAESHCHI